MLQLVLEILLNRTPPSTIAANIASQLALVNPGAKIESLHGECYIRKCRTILRIFGETITAYRLGKQEKWKQLFTDGTS